MVNFNDLKQKKIFITGSSRGIGKDIATALAENGCHLILSSRQQTSQLDQQIEDLKKKGASEIHVIIGDLTNWDIIKSQLDNFISEHGPFDGLINNAGLSLDGLALRVKPSQIDDVLALNLKSSMVLTNYLLKSFLKNDYSSIIHISSIVGLMGNSGQSTYAASKAGLIGYSKSIAKEMASRQIRSNVIAPGFITTEMTAKLPTETQENYKKNIPLGHFGEGKDVAMLCLFLLSQASRYITGEVIKIDGGLYI